MKTIVVLPAYNASKTLEQTVNSIPVGCCEDIVLVDDLSVDSTVCIAKALNLTVICHEKNKGYGANQKTCYRIALEMGADIVVMLHPDNQYDPRLVPFLSGLIKEGVCDIVFACRIRTRKETLRGGMPFYKYLANRFLTIIENLTFGLNLGEYHTGYRAFSKKSLETIDFDRCSDDFVFDQHIVAQAAICELTVGDIPVPTKYFKESSSISLIRSFKYGFEVLWLCFRYVLHKWKILPFKMLQSKKNFIS
ncbi:MAG: glycosyltransferase family 2 protein [Elusimicrobiota bacterium]|jgi:glycosyltransferase involved in cell wall biosynthesis|nr:glycosyltransferase family 2 protein [Elusimicrobiota bacterium]